MRVDPKLANYSQVCVSFHLPQLMLLYSIMRAPRLDAGVLSDVSHAVVEHMVKMTPLCLMPYDNIPVQYLNPFTQEQECLCINAAKGPGPTQLLRFGDSGVISRGGLKQGPAKLKGGSGVVEDEAHMVTIIEMARALQVCLLNHVILTCFDSMSAKPRYFNLFRFYVC